MVTYLRQLGKERTGTNYVKALLACNFDAINLFDDRLGSKHGVFNDVNQWMQENRIKGEADIQRFMRTNKYWRQRNDREKPLVGLESVHKPVSYDELAALSSGQVSMHYIISIKNPYSFAISINRWITRKLRGFMVPPGYFELDMKVIKEQCKHYNRVYESYLPLLGKKNVILIRYEDLISDFDGVMEQLAQKFTLVRRSVHFSDVERIVTPYFGVTRANFNKEYYQKHQYMEAIDEKLHACINQNIDWKILQAYGYQTKVMVSA